VCDTSRLPYILDNRLTGGGEVSSLGSGRALPAGRFFVLISVSGLIYPRTIVRLNVLRQLKNVMTVINIIIFSLPSLHSQILLFREKLQAQMHFLHYFIKVLNSLFVSCGRRYFPESVPGRVLHWSYSTGPQTPWSITTSTMRS
jgi:hypothetical protein